MIARGLSARRACELLGLSRSSFAYRSAPKRNEELTARLLELAGDEPKLGYRMAWTRLRHEFAPLNLKRVRRIWREQGLHLKRKKSRRIKGAKKPDVQARRPGEVWCMGFAHDACSNGTKIKCLAVIDESSRECLAMEVSWRIPSEKVITALEGASLNMASLTIFAVTTGQSLHPGPFGSILRAKALVTRSSSLAVLGRTALPIGSSA